MSGEIVDPPDEQQALFDKCHALALELGLGLPPITVMWIDPPGGAECRTPGRIPGGITRRFADGSIEVRINCHVRGRQLAEVVLHELKHCEEVHADPRTPVDVLEAHAAEFTVHAIARLDPAAWEATG